MKAALAPEHISECTMPLHPPNASPHLSCRKFHPTHRNSPRGENGTSRCVLLPKLQFFYPDRQFRPLPLPGRDHPSLARRTDRQMLERAGQPCALSKAALGWHRKLPHGSVEISISHCYGGRGETATRTHDGPQKQVLPYVDTPCLVLTAMLPGRATVGP